MHLMKTLPALCIALLAPVIARGQDVPVDWSTLAAEFTKDVAAAEAKYQDKMLTVTGPVSAIAQGDMTLDNPSIAVTLSTADGPGSDVKLLFEPQDLEPNTQIHVSGDNSEALIQKLSPAGKVESSRPMIQIGQQVTATGTFIDYQGGDIVLRHAKLGGGLPR